MPITVKTADGHLIAKDYSDVCKSLVNDLAYTERSARIKMSGMLTESDTAKTRRYLLLYSLKALRENIKYPTESDYEVFFEDDEGGLFDLLSYYYEMNSSDEFIKIIGERLIRNFEICMNKKINADVCNRLEEMKEGVGI